MAVDYSASLAYGFEITEDQLSEVVSRLGISASPDPEKHLEALCREIEATYWLGANMYSGEIYSIVIGPRNCPESMQSQHQDTHIDAGGTLRLSDLMMLEPEIDRIEVRLADLGVEVEEPVVTVSFSVY